MKKYAAVCLLSVLALCLTACAAAETEQTPSLANAVTVTDMLGREVTLSEPATRIVALTAADCEIIYALGRGDTLVGRGEYCTWPVEVENVPAVQSGSETNIEQIIALEPQLLFMSSMEQTKEQVAQLEQAGVRVVISDADDIAGTYQAIEMIGALLGRSEAAAALVSDMSATFDRLSAAAGESGDTEKTVYFEVSPLEWGLWTAGSHTFMNEAAELLGLTNCFADVEGWVEISEEQVIDRDPDYIVTITMYYGEGPTPEEEIASRFGWENITAVREGRILNLRNDELSRPGPRLAEGTRLLYDFVYGAEK